MAKFLLKSNLYLNPVLGKHMFEFASPEARALAKNNMSQLTLCKVPSLIDLVGLTF